MKIRRIIFSSLMILWMLVIFAFSSRNGSESTDDSYHVGMLFGKIVCHDFESWSEEDQLAFAAKVDHPIRKTAHAAEYAFLALLSFGTVAGKKAGEGKGEAESSPSGSCDENVDAVGERAIWKRLIANPYLCAWAIATLYAATDEFHQLFVAGRSGKVLDVVNDSGGAFVGLLVLFGLIKLFEKRHKKSSQR